MAQFGQRVLTTTQDSFAPYVVDTVLNSNVLLKKVLGKAKAWDGETKKFPIFYKKGISGKFFNGADTLPTAVSDTRVNMEYTPTNYSINVSLPVDEISYNTGKSQVTDLLKLELNRRSQEMADDLGDTIYGDGTSGAFNGLGNLVDDGTTAASIGGLSRTTYTTLKSTVTDSTGDLTLLKMNNLWFDVSSGSITPDKIITTQEVFGLYESLREPGERYYRTGSEKNRSAGAGYSTLDYKGVDVMADEKCTEGVMFFLNMDHLDFYSKPFGTQVGYKAVNYMSTDIEGNEYSSVKGLGFHTTGWIKPSNAHMVISHIVLSGNFITDNPKRLGKLTGITGV